MAAIVAVVPPEQTEISGPALAVVGGNETYKITSSKFEAQAPFEIVQRNVYTPAVSPVTVAVGLVRLLNTAPPLPDTSDQLPVPTVGVFAAIVAEVPQIV